MFYTNKKNGFTLIELITTLIVLIIIAAGSSAILIFFIQNTIFLPSQMNVQQAADAAMEIIIEGDLQAGGLRFATEITNIRRYIDGDIDLIRVNNSDGQDIRYRINRNTSRLERSIDNAGWEIIPYYAADNLMVTRNGNALFEYFDGTENPTTIPANVRRIRINLLARTGTGDINNWEGEVKLSSSVKLYKFNQPPTVTIYEVTHQNQQNRYRIRFEVQDPDRGYVSWSVSLSPDNAGYIGDRNGNPIVGNGRNVTYTRTIFYYYDSGFMGTATVAVEVNDGNGGIAEDSVDIQRP